MANHLTPEELSKEVGIERDRGDPDLHRGARPDLPGQDRQDPVPGAPGRDQRAPASSTSRTPSETLRPRRGRALARAPAGFGAAARLSPLRGGDRGAQRLHQVDRPAPSRPRPPAPRARGRRASPRAAPCSRARYSLRSSAGSNVALEPGDDLLRERELLLLDAGRRDRLVDLLLALHVLGEEQRLERERVALRPDQAELLLAGEHERAEPDDARPRASPRAAARTAAAAPRSRPGRGSRCGRSRPGRPRRPGRTAGSRSTREVS